jgi:hypothetical protein
MWAHRVLRVVPDAEHASTDESANFAGLPPDRKIA